jgi:hypothetical protein
MYEAIITFVKVESTDGRDGPVLQYPTTKVYRVEFDTENGFDDLIVDLHGSNFENKYMVANVEQLRA